MANDQKDPTGITPEEQIETNEHGGMQCKIGTAFTLIPPESMIRVAKVFRLGAEKHSAENWRLIPASDHLEHALRHLNLLQQGVHDDEEGDEDHAAHAVTRLLMAMAYLDEAVPHPGHWSQFGPSAFREFPKEEDEEGGGPLPHKGDDVAVRRRADQVLVGSGTVTRVERVEYSSFLITLSTGHSYEFNNHIFSPLDEEEDDSKGDADHCHKAAWKGPPPGQADAERVKPEVGTNASSDSPLPEIGSMVHVSATKGSGALAAVQGTFRGVWDGNYILDYGEKGEGSLSCANHDITEME